MNRKGFTYLISAIILAGILLAVIAMSNDYTLSDEQRSSSKRLIYTNDFVKGFNQDFERALQISSVRALVSLEDFMALNHTFYNDTESSFRETLYYGTINGTPSGTMSNSTLLNYTSKVEIISKRFGINVSVNITDIRLSQTNPWYIDVEADAMVFINDTANSACWEYNRTYNAKVSIIDLRDPFYIVYFPNSLHNTIRKNNFTYFVSPDNNTYNLSNHTINSFYIANADAPSYIMRMENNYSPSVAGIESIVNIDKLKIQFPNHPSLHPERIKVDYIYFNNLTKNSSGSSFVKICNITNLPDEIILTQERLGMYNVSMLNYTFC